MPHIWCYNCKSSTVSQPAGNITGSMRIVELFRRKNEAKCRSLIFTCCRKGEYDEAVESLMSLGGAMLRVGGSNLLQYISSPSPIAGPVEVDRIGVAATEEDTALSEEEKLHRLQVLTQSGKI